MTLRIWLNVLICLVICIIDWCLLNMIYIIYLLLCIVCIFLLNRVMIDGIAHSWFIDKFIIRIWMIEIEPKRKFKSSEGTHFYYSLIFVAAAALIKFKYKQADCNGLKNIVELVFFTQLIWGTYQFLTMIPKYKVPAMKIFVLFLKVLYYLSQLGIVAYCYF